MIRQFTAKDARALAGPTIEERVNDVLDLIEETARAGNRCIYLDIDDFWTKGGYDGTKEWKAACRLLESLGFTTKFEYGEGQFVRMGTIVEW